MRFNTFIDQWITKTIVQYGKFHYGKSAPKWSVSAEGTIPCVRYGELYTRDLAKINSIKSYTTIDFEHLVFSTGKEVLVPRVGEDPMDFYKCAYLPIKNVAIGEMISIYETNQDPLFVTYYFRGKMRKKFAQKVEGGNVSNLYYNYLEPLKVSFPTLAEQQKIAIFLDLLDQRIDTQSKIIEDLELCKKKIYYEIFSAKESYVKPLGSIISYGKAGGTPESTNKSYYNGNIPFLSISDMTEQGKYILKTEKTLSELGLKNSSAWLVSKNSLILSMYASVGFVSISKVELATSQAMFSMIIEDKNLLEYVYYYLNYFKSFKIHRLLETGTQSNINAEMVKNINIPFFDQTKNLLITQFFNNFDLKIKKEKDILELYKKQKAYLLKNMFI